jgi:hypothetical protein
MPWAEIIALTGAGEANTSSNAGAGVGLAKAKAGVDLPFKSLVAGANVTLTSGADTVTIASAAGTGEANTASNVGTGEGLVFKGKSGVNFEFKRIAAGSNITVTNGSNDITIAASSSGEANTTSNAGAGVGLAKAKAGVDLPFKSLVAGSNISITGNADDVTIASTASGFTAGGDLSGTSTSQTVVGIRQTTVGTAGGSHPTGRVLRTTGTTTCDWGAVDLGNSNARTGTLPIANGGTGVTALPGSTGNPLINNNGPLGAATNWTFGVDGLASGSTGFIAFGTSAVTGQVRLPAVSSIKVRNSTNTADLVFASSDGAALPTITVGESSVQNVFLSASVSGTTGLWASRHRFGNSAINAEWFSIDSAEVLTRVPIRGMASASSPYGSDGDASKDYAVGTFTVTSTEYVQKIQRVRLLSGSGTRTLNYPTPAANAGYVKHFILENEVDGASTVVIGIVAGGLTVSVSVGAGGPSTPTRVTLTVAFTNAGAYRIGAVG